MVNEKISCRVQGLAESSNKGIAEYFSINKIAGSKFIAAINIPHWFSFPRLRCGFLSLFANLVMLFLSIILMGLQPPFVHAQIQFQEVTQAAGILYSGKSFGAAWADVNGDGWPDLYVSNHNPPILYLNNADGTFMDATNIVLYTGADRHGAAWADFDNDGDQDLIELVGAGYGVGSGPNQFFVNSNGLLQNRAVEYGLDYPLGRGRTPLWFDWNSDGYLDVFFANIARSDGQAPSALFTQQDNYFSNDNSITGITTGAFNYYAQIANMSVQNNPTLVIQTTWSYPDRIYQYDSLPFLDKTDTLGFPSSYSVWDSAIADFDGDLLVDFYLPHRAWTTSVALQIDTNNIKAGIYVRDSEKGIQFRAIGNVNFEIYSPEKIGLLDIYIGSAGTNPVEREFTLSSADAGSEGIFPHTPGVDLGVFIGYEPVTDLWHLDFSTNGANKLFFLINADTQISELTNVGFENSEGELSDFLLIQTTGGSLQDNTVPAGLDIPTACESVAAADFDNDMDIDIYLVCPGAVTNRSNILYENLGNGTFQAVTAAGGAEGSSVGRGETVTTVDYDRDGFMDIFITNGLETWPSSPFGIGPHQLFRNVGNGNHWLEIDLEGVVSNRDGIGARLLATAGSITQLREQSGGMHKFSQNHQRIHFGLANNTMVEQLTIQWPSGIVQEIDNIVADQIFHAVELDITASLTRGPAPLTVDFTSNASGYYQPLSYEWDFDNDGVIDSTVQNPSYTYGADGIYTVKLTVTDFDGSVYTSIREDYISVCPPVKNLRDSEYYSTLQAAYDGALEGDTIQSIAWSFTETLSIDRPISVILDVGYDCNYLTINGITTLNGDMIISDGIVTIQGGTFEVQ